MLIKSSTASLDKETTASRCFQKTGLTHNTRWTAFAPSYKKTLATDWPMNPTPTVDENPHRHKNRDIHTWNKISKPSKVAKGLSESQKERQKDLFQAVYSMLTQARKGELSNVNNRDLTLDDLTDGEEEEPGVKGIGSRDVEERRLLKRLIRNCSDINVSKPNDIEMKTAIATIDQHVRLIGTLGVSRLRYFDTVTDIKEKDESYFVHVIKRPDSVNPITNATVSTASSNFWKIIR
jgi:hypothetical protein